MKSLFVTMLTNKFPWGANWLVGSEPNGHQDTVSQNKTGQVAEMTKVASPSQSDVIFVVMIAPWKCYFEWASSLHCHLTCEWQVSRSRAWFGLFRSIGGCRSEQSRVCSELFQSAGDCQSGRSHVWIELFQSAGSLPIRTLTRLVRAVSIGRWLPIRTLASLNLAFPISCRPPFRTFTVDLSCSNRLMLANQDAHTFGLSCSNRLVKSTVKVLNGGRQLIGKAKFNDASVLIGNHLPIETALTKRVSVLIGKEPADWNSFLPIRTLARLVFVHLLPGWRWRRGTSRRLLPWPGWWLPFGIVPFITALRGLLPLDLLDLVLLSRPLLGWSWEKKHCQEISVSRNHRSMFWSSRTVPNWRTWRALELDYSIGPPGEASLQLLARAKLQNDHLQYDSQVSPGFWVRLAFSMREWPWSNNQDHLLREVEEWVLVEHATEEL